MRSVGGDAMRPEPDAAGRTVRIGAAEARRRGRAAAPRSAGRTSRAARSGRVPCVYITNAASSRPSHTRASKLSASGASCRGGPSATRAPPPPRSGRHTRTPWRRSGKTLALRPYPRPRGTRPTPPRTARPRQSGARAGRRSVRSCHWESRREPIFYALDAVPFQHVERLVRRQGAERLARARGSGISEVISRRSDCIISAISVSRRSTARAGRRGSGRPAPGCRRPRRRR